MELHAHVVRGPADRGRRRATACEQREAESTEVPVHDHVLRGAHRPGESAGEGYKKVKRADRYAIMFELVVLAVFLALLGGAAGPIISGHLAPLFWGGLVVAGLVIPLLLDVSGLKLPGAVPAALVLVGGFILRYVIVMANA